jgi:hypothetical protein
VALDGVLNRTAPSTGTTPIQRRPREVDTGAQQRVIGQVPPLTPGDGDERVEDRERRLIAK